MVLSSQTSSISIIWEIVRKADSRAPAQIRRIRNSRDRTQQTVLQQALQEILMHVQM